LQPAFSHYYLNLGEISSNTYIKRYASVFCHTNPWIMAAEASLGHGDQAHDYYLRINPSARESIMRSTAANPMPCQTIAGKDAPTSVRPRTRGCVHGRLEFRRHHSVILVFVRRWMAANIAGIPTAWKGFEAQRKYRG
jgi:cellobiose phosphorylase